MGGEGSGRKVDAVKRIIEQRTNIADTGSEGFFIPNYSGVSHHVPTIAELDKRYQPIGSAGTELDPIFIATSGSFLTAETDPVFMALSGTLSVTETDPIFIATSGSFLTSESDPKWLAQSGSYTLKTYSESLSGSVATLRSEFNTTSGAYYTHAADTSDPHGANITQTGLTVTTLSGSKFVMTSDSDTSGAAILRNILIGTEATPGPASNYTQGTVYLKYTA